MKKMLAIISLAILGLFVSSCYDDSALWESMKGYENRIVELEKKYATLNDEVSSLKTLVSAVQQGDYITNVAPLKESGKEVGYIITFAKNGTITIRHGQDGESGTTPKVGVKKDTDGVYYWTVNGEWLLDDSGKKVKAVGTDGKDGTSGEPGENGTNGTPGAPGEDGVTPLLKIENEYWYVSYDGGKTWKSLDCKATGDDGAPGTAESIFKSIYQKDGSLCLELTDGSIFMIPMSSLEVLGIDIDIEPGAAIVPGTAMKVKYTVKGGDDDVLVRAIMNDDFFYVVVKPENAYEGYIYLVLSEWFDGADDEDRYDDAFDGMLEDDIDSDATMEDFFNSFISVIITVTDGKGNQATKVLNLEEGKISALKDAYIADAVAGTVTAQVKTNVDYKVQVPEKDTWLSYTPATRADFRTDELLFTLEENKDEYFRGSDVELVNDLGQTIESFVVLQRSSLAGEAIAFADENVESACVSAFDTNLDGKLSYEEAALVSDLEKLHFPINGVSFNEFQYFTSVTEIPDYMFEDCSLLKEIVFPSNLKVIGNGAFSYSGLMGSEVMIDGRSVIAVQIPESVERIEYSAFRTCYYLKAVQFLSQNPCRFGYMPFNGDVVLYVPDGAYDEYRSVVDDDANIFNWAEKESIEVIIDGDTDNPIAMTEIEDDWYFAEIELLEEEYFHFRADGSDELDFSLSYEVPEEIVPGVKYELSWESGRYQWMEPGKYKLYVAEDMSIFYYEVDSPECEKLTIAEFLEKEEGDVFYELTGVITNLKNSVYGNFDLTDDTGTVYVYGLTATPAEKNDKSFASLGLKAGDTVTIRGTRSSYNAQVQVGGPAYYVSHVAGEEIVVSVETVTIAQFLEKEVSTTDLYRVTGAITLIQNTTYGNLYIKDDSGIELYVYGLKENATAENKSFSNIGLVEGDIVTIVGYRSEYNGVPQMKEAYYESHESPGTEPEPENPGFEAGAYWIMGTKDNVTKVMAPIAEGRTYGYASSEDIVDGRSYAKNVFTFTAVDGGFTIQDATGRFYSQDASYRTFNVGEDGTLPSCVWTVTRNDDDTYSILNSVSGKAVRYAEGTYTSFGAYSDEEANGSVLVTLVKADSPLEEPGEDPEEPVESEIPWTLGEKAYTEKATINETEVSVLKLGTSSVVGTAQIKIPAGTTTAKFSALAWKGKSTVLTFTAEGLGTIHQVTLKGNDGVSGSAPYTITTDGSEVQTIDVYNLVANINNGVPAPLPVDLVVTVTTDAENYRAILWGFEFGTQIP